MDKTELCRLCALQRNNLLSIFGEEGIRLCIENKIKKCLNIQLNEENVLPKSICMECCSKLDAFYEFFENSSNAQNTLRNIFSKNDLSEAKHIISEGPENFVDTEDGDFDERKNFNLDSLSEENDNHSYDGCNLEPVSLTDGCNVQNKVILNVTHDNTVNNGEGVVNSKKQADWDIDTWLCSDCSEELASVENLRQHHLSEHKQEPKYMCVYCSKLFLLYSAFTAHLKRHKNSLKYNCHECGKGFSNKKVLETHTLTHSDARPYACQDCGKSFRQQSALYIHSRCHLPDDVKNKFPCDLCNKRFSTKPNLVTHMRIHTGIRNFTCDQCGKSFIKKGNLDAHLLTHSHDKPFSCELCSKRFKTGMQLRKHHTVHTGAKPYQCDVCGRTFREKGTLREHQRIHTGAMPFTCEYCGKTFRFKGILTTHRRQHTGERPYSCLECQHHFTNWPNYNKHMKRRHGINTSRSTRITSGSAGECEVAPSHIYQDIQPSTDLYQTHPTYIYNVCSLSQVTAIDPILI